MPYHATRPKHENAVTITLWRAQQDIENAIKELMYLTGESTSARPIKVESVVHQKQALWEVWHRLNATKHYYDTEGDYIPAGSAEARRGTKVKLVIR